MQYVKYVMYITQFSPHNNPMNNTIIVNTLQTRKLKHRGLMCFPEGPTGLGLILEPHCQALC